MGMYVDYYGWALALGVKKRAETCSCNTYCKTQYNNFCCVL